MHDTLVSRATIVTEGFWILAGLAVSAVWVLAIMGAPLAYEIAVAVLAVAALTAAATWQVRTYVMRLSALVRLVGGLETPPDATLHRIDSQGTR